MGIWEKILQRKIQKEVPYLMKSSKILRTFKMLKIIQSIVKMEIIKIELLNNYSHPKLKVKTMSKYTLFKT